MTDNTPRSLWTLRAFMTGTTPERRDSEPDVEKSSEQSIDSRRQSWVTQQSMPPPPPPQQPSSFPSAANEAHHDPPPPCTDWDGPNDPGNPQNWSLRMKAYHSFIPGAIAFVCTYAASVYTPALDAVRAEFHISSELALLPYIFYVLGSALGPFLSAPLSETFGRRAIYLGAIPIFALFTMGAGLSTTIASLITCRFFAGVFGSPGLSVGSAMLSDFWLPQERAVPMAFFLTTPFLGPAVGPLIGGYVTYYRTWRWTQWTILMFTAIGLLPAFGMRETYKTVLLAQRSKTRGHQPPKSPRTFWQSTLFFTRSTLTRPVHMCFVEPVVACTTLYISLNFAMLYSFFAAFPYVFARAYGFGIRATGLTFLGLGGGVLVACAILIFFALGIYKPMVQKSKAAGTGGKVAPEHRLYIAMLGSLCLPIGLFWFAWTAQPHIHWISPIIAESLFGCGNLLIFSASVLYIMDFYGPLYGASAMGSNNLFRYLFGAAFPLFIVQMYERLGIQWATSLLGFISLALMPIPWVFYRWGPRLRARSRYQKG